MEYATPEEAVVALMRRLKPGHELRVEALRLACQTLIARVRSEIRSGVDNEYLDGRERGARRHSAALEGRITLFDWPLPNSAKKLGDATVGDLSDAAMWHEAAAAGETRRAKMYLALYERLKKSKRSTVREAMSENDAAQIMKIEGET